MSKYTNIISKFNKKSILVVGDIILDRYIKGSVTRICPEAPVPIVLEHESFYRPGGAANVAHNLVTLGAKVTQVGKIGNDFEGSLLKRDLRKKKIDVSGIYLDKNVPTITKTRVIAGQQQVVRIDKERPHIHGDEAVTAKIFNFIKKNIDQYDGVILSDYGKGVLTGDLINTIITLAKEHKKIITVDPKIENFRYYQHVTSITPNLKETENAIRDIKVKSDSGNILKINVDRLTDEKMIEKAGQALMEYLDLDSLLITLSEKGMKLFEKGKKTVSIATVAKEVFDVTGAGDAVISVFTLAMVSGATKRKAAELANLAGGIVVGKVGAVAVSCKELEYAAKGH